MRTTQPVLSSSSGSSVLPCLLGAPPPNPRDFSLWANGMRSVLDVLVGANGRRRYMGRTAVEDRSAPQCCVPPLGRGSDAKPTRAQACLRDGTATVYATKRLDSCLRRNDKRRRRAEPARPSLCAPCLSGEEKSAFPPLCGRGGPANGDCFRFFGFFL